LAVVALAAAVLGGCGRERIQAADLEFEAAKDTRLVAYPDVGMRFRAPSNVRLIRRPAPGVFRGGAGDAFLSGFAYRRAEQLPRNRRELAAARRRLVAATRKRGRGYRLTSARSIRVGGAQAVELLGDQRISNARLRTRSLHVYRGRAEYVIEVAADLKSFASLDRTVYRPIRRSLRVTGRIRRR
jgi:hypothetical protein